MVDKTVDKTVFPKAVLKVDLMAVKMVAMKVDLKADK